MCVLINVRTFILKKGYKTQKLMAKRLSMWQEKVFIFICYLDIYLEGISSKIANINVTACENWKFRLRHHDSTAIKSQSEMPEQNTNHL